jgi:hypothetical protein
MCSVVFMILIGAMGKNWFLTLLLEWSSEIQQSLIYVGFRFLNLTYKKGDRF